MSEESEQQHDERPDGGAGRDCPPSTGSGPGVRIQGDRICFDCWALDYFTARRFLTKLSAAIGQLAPAVGPQAAGDGWRFLDEREELRAADEVWFPGGLVNGVRYEAGWIRASGGTRNRLRKYRRRLEDNRPPDFDPEGIDGWNVGENYSDADPH